MPSGSSAGFADVWDLCWRCAKPSLYKDNQWHMRCFPTCLQEKAKKEKAAAAKRKSSGASRPAKVRQAGRVQPGRCIVASQSRQSGHNLKHRCLSLLIPLPFAMPCRRRPRRRRRASPRRRARCGRGHVLCAHLSLAVWPC